MVNRPGNVVSHDDSAEWIDKAVELVWDHADTITLRGDTDFSLTANFDRWAQKVDSIPERFDMYGSHPIGFQSSSHPRNGP